MPMTNERRRSLRLIPVAIVALLGAACTDGANPLAKAPAPASPGGAVPLQLLECTATRTAVTCAPARPGSSGSLSDIILGGGAVKLTSSNVHYDGVEKFTFDVTVQNLIQQPIGTTDGITPDPNGIDVFFNVQPFVTSGSGSITVEADGIGTFTASNQPYYQYSTILAQSAVSSPRTWTFDMPPTVGSFSFSVYVYAAVQYPSGYVQLDGYLPGAGTDSLQVGTTRALATVVKTASGATVPGATVTYATSDSGCATVDGAGTVTGVAPGTCTITATSGARSGSIGFTITP
ncbi:Ig-like domain-containing protein [Longimicrobium sp.]|uniref:Ig-like domain-containing protein n=1 Tax=Longimicrobium sp. TaxID=2029185 RepID=UPI002BB78E98|nr:Ig-like domain-containing protein [Longimicrobium sp.]HSU17329.1 Ig-like domain-containing protein [Longimicrobium sp.]